MSWCLIQTGDRYAFDRCIGEYPTREKAEEAENNLRDDFYKYYGSIVMSEEEMKKHRVSMAEDFKKVGEIRCNDAMRKRSTWERKHYLHIQTPYMYSSYPRNSSDRWVPQLGEDGFLRKIGVSTNKETDHG